MKTLRTQPRRFEFGFPLLDASVLVEDFGNAVVIRATRDTFTEQRKAAFVRELAAEGFIDSSYQWFGLAGPDTYFGVQWHVDFSWLELPHRLLARTNRLMVAFELGSLAAWGVLMSIFLRH
ncbi:MAG TPA: hypothetical protein VHD32_16015 [Candidatus Didemnitutus sp.]|nr:hypothetical protein [Candidatus Didemnitutus sp.]